ncbi:hypothetical protein HDV02_006618 [Globomyces sp. JEL0801]|nr:hypothetical protein HDV02_006618 [Globomyces sp. JEL0801]
MIEEILSILRIKQTEILFVFLYGSRLWGNAHPKSDFDLLVVVKDSKMKPLKSQHGRQFDITVLDESDYQQAINDGSFLELITLFVPNANVLYNATKRYSFKLEYFANLEAFCIERVAKDRVLAGKMLVKNRQKSHKILIHGVRTIILSIRMVEFIQLQTPIEFQVDWDLVEMETDDIFLEFDKECQHHLQILKTKIQKLFR